MLRRIATACLPPFVGLAAILSAGPTWADPAAWTTLTLSDGGRVPVRFVNGDVQCASYDGTNCLWGVTAQQAQTAWNLQPLACGAMHRAAWGVRGYETRSHWCSVAYASLYATWRPASAASVEVLYSVNPDGDVQCYSADGHSCAWGQVSLPAPSSQAIVAPLACGEMHRTQYSTDGYSDPNHWCHKIRAARSNYTVSTLAGGGAGRADGTGTAAKFYAPVGLAVDPTNGDVIVGDVVYGLIRRVTPAGVVTTLAGGNAAQGQLDGTGAAASFSYPGAIAVDANGNSYVGDAKVVRLVTAGGTVTTLPQAGVSGCTSATSLGIRGVALSTDPASQGTSPVLLLASAERNQIQPLSIATGQSCTSAFLPMGSGSAGTSNGFINAAYGSPVASFTYPYSISADPRGNLHVFDHDIGMIKIRRIDAAWKMASTLADGAALGRGTDGSVATDAFGTAFVVSRTARTVRMITPGGVVTAVAGSGASGTADGVGGTATFEDPIGLAVDRKNGNLYVSDVGADAHNIRKLTPQLP